MCKGISGIIHQRTSIILLVIFLVVLLVAVFASPYELNNAQRAAQAGKDFMTEKCITISIKYKPNDSNRGGFNMQYVLKSDNTGNIKDNTCRQVLPGGVLIISYQVFRNKLADVLIERKKQ